MLELILGYKSILVVSDNLTACFCMSGVLKTDLANLRWLTPIELKLCVLTQLFFLQLFISYTMHLVWYTYGSTNLQNSPYTHVYTYMHVHVHTYLCTGLIVHFTIGH